MNREKIIARLTLLGLYADAVGGPVAGLADNPVPAEKSSCFS
jgi:hypothetical protein